jgi:Holliday junction DNA helicase RuvB
MLKTRDNLRPATLEGYIGQEQVKDLLETSILAAKGRNEPLDHVLLNGPPGLGKTTLALIIANMMERKLKIILGPSLGGPRDVVTLVLLLPKSTDLFIDEIHRVRKATQEVLYPLLEDGILHSTLSSAEMPVPPMTIMGATTNIGRLEQPFIDRFGLQFQLQYYKVDELATILAASAEKLKVKVDNDVLVHIAQRSRGTPRIANNILKRVRDYSVVLKVDKTTPEFTDKIILEKLRTDELGLRPLDYRYLRTLNRAPASIGVQTIASTINEEVETVEDFIEPFLLSLGFIQRERTGRCLTEAGDKFIAGKGRMWK